MVMERSRWMPRMYERQNLPSCCCGLSIGARLVRHPRGAWSEPHEGCLAVCTWVCPAAMSERWVRSWRMAWPEGARGRAAGRVFSKGR